MFRIHSSLRVISRQSHKLKMPPQNYDSFLVLDFEATCQEGIKISKPVSMLCICKRTGTMSIPYF